MPHRLAAHSIVVWRVGRDDSSPCSPYASDDGLELGLAGRAGLQTTDVGADPGVVGQRHEFPVAR